MAPPHIYEYYNGWRERDALRTRRFCSRRSRPQDYGGGGTEGAGDLRGSVLLSCASGLMQRAAHGLDIRANSVGAMGRFSLIKRSGALTGSLLNRRLVSLAPARR